MPLLGGNNQNPGPYPSTIPPNTSGSVGNNDGAAGNDLPTAYPSPALFPSPSSVPAGTRAYSLVDNQYYVSNGVLWSSGTGVNANPTGRPPVSSDNTTAGYTSSSVWQYRGVVYTPTTYMGSDCALWNPVPQSAVGTPVDIMGVANTKFAGGTCAMLKDYVGSAIDVAVTISGVYQIFTIAMLATGELDNVALGAAMAQADANTNCKVLKIYDQTGNGNHAALGSSTGVPNVINGTISGSTTLTVNSQTSGPGPVATNILYGNGVTVGTTISSGSGPYTLSAGSPLNPGPETMYLANTSCPYIDWDPNLGRYVIYSPNESGATAGTTNQRTLQFPQTMALTSGQNIGLCVIGVGESGGNKAYSILAQIGDQLVNSTRYINFWGNNSTVQNVYGQLQCYDSQTGAKTVPVTIIDQPMVFVAGTSSSNPYLKINVNEAQGTEGTGTFANQALNGGWLFNNTGAGSTQAYSMMKVCGFCIFNAAPTAAQSQALRFSAYARFNIFPQVTNTVALVGDSRFANSLVTPHFGTSEILSRILGRNWNVVNYGIATYSTASFVGDGLVPTVTGAAKSLATLKTTGTNYAVILLGINDFLVNGTTVSVALANLKILVQQLAAVGYTPILIAELQTTSSTGNANVNLPLLRAAIVQAGAAGMGCAVIDMYGYTPVTTPGNTAYYVDGIHPSLALHQVIASAIGNQLQ